MSHKPRESSMRLAIYLDGSGEAALRRLALNHELRVPPDIPSLTGTIKARDCDAVVFDPEIVRSDVFRGVLRPVGMSGCAALWYTGVEADRLLLEAALAGYGEVMLREYPASGRSFDSRIAYARTGRARGKLLERLAASLGRLPITFRRASIEMFGGKSIPPSVRALEASSGAARRSLDRAARRVGFGTAAIMLDCLRVAVSWDALIVRGTAGLVDSATSPYATMRGAIASYKRVLGVTPRSALHSLRTDDVVAMLARYLSVSSSGEDRSPVATASEERASLVASA